MGVITLPAPVRWGIGDACDPEGRVWVIALCCACTDAGEGFAVVNVLHGPVLGPALEGGLRANPGHFEGVVDTFEEADEGR